MFGIAPTHVQNLSLALLNFMRFAPAHLSSLSGLLWMASLPSRVSTVTVSLVSSENWLRVHSIPLSVSPSRMLNNSGPSTNPVRQHSSLLSTQTLKCWLWLWVWPPSQFFISHVAHQSNQWLSNLETRMSCGKKIFLKNLFKCYKNINILE